MRLLPVRLLIGAGALIASITLAGCASVDTSSPRGFEADPCQSNFPIDYRLSRSR